MYYYGINRPEKITTHRLLEQGEDLYNVRTLEDLGQLFHQKLKRLKAIGKQPKYYQFFLPKSMGKQRLIENPDKELKGVQKRLSYLLQGMYHKLKPDCAYGFIVSTADETETRNIYSNAERHINSKWVLNIDLKNFFHSISHKRIRLLFNSTLFQCSENVTKLLTRLVTFQKRLPMGSPTSPVLSNLVCLDLDAILEDFAQQEALTYTRFADDMTFSSLKKITPAQIEQIKAIIRQEGFNINEEKLRLNRTRDEPEVTGLLLKEGKPDISKSFLSGIKEDIKLFHQLTTLRMIEKNSFPAKHVKRFQQSIIGQLNFVRFVRGENHKSYIKLKQKLFARRVG